MKKILSVIAAAMLFSTAAYAQSIDLGGDVSNGKKTEITGLEDGYYDLTVTCKNSAIDENTFIYGQSEDYTMSSTVLPKSDEGVKVTVRGIGVSGGKCEIGVESNGKGKIEISDADLTKSEKSSFIAGGDMTEVSYIESLGGEYKDADGNKVDPFEFLAQNGVNMARIRLTNTTGKGTGDGTYYLPEGFQDEADCLELSKRAKAAGMGIQFTFNYSDYWSNGDRQIIPSEWVKKIKDELGYDVKDKEFLNNMTAEQKKEIQQKLGDIVYDYTYDIMTKLKEQGTVPEYVSLGNEINGGILFPFGNTFNANMNSGRFELVYGDDTDEENDIKCYEDWAGLTSILNRGYDAVKAVSPDSQVIIHLANGSKESVFTWFLDKYESAGGKYDVIGASYYPAWSENPVEACTAFCSNISKKYDKDILIMETGYNWNDKKKNGYDGQLTANAPGYDEKYPFTQEGHAGFMADLINGMKSVDDGRCLGILYWDPCMIHVEDEKNPNESLSGWAITEKEDLPAGNVVENTTLFDFDGKAISTVDVFKNSQNSVNVFKNTINDDKNGNISAVVKNTSDEVKTAVLNVVVYDENGVINQVRNTSLEIAPNEKKTLQLNVQESNYKVFLWNGTEFEK